ncbi:arrestin domain-containing protein 1-like [Chironomus tepperi]|uniref:arrestin domain-containing protein 1-like n=1 Tax=Chironomus tepperi TaxID=113505 RepID=UPI00391F4A75
MVRDINVYIEPNSNGTLDFHPGHLLKGMVEYPLDHVENIHCFSVTVVGKAEVIWQKNESIRERSGDTVTIEHFDVNYWGTEYSLNEETYLMGVKKGPLITLQPGVYRYNFSCQLPQNLPSSFSGKFGEISYCVESNIDLENRYRICFGHTPFNVIRIDDLNLYPELRSTFKLEKVKSFCFIFCTGSLVMTVTTPCTGFAIGQSVPIKIEYLNKSSVDVKHTKVTLKRTVRFTCQHPKTETKKFDDIIISVVAQGVKARQSDRIESILEIPMNLACSNDRYCRIVNIKYSVDIEGELSMFHSNPKISIPITIGNFQARPVF